MGADSQCPVAAGQPGERVALMSSGHDIGHKRDAHLARCGLGHPINFARGSKTSVWVSKAQWTADDELPGNDPAVSGLDEPAQLANCLGEWDLVVEVQPHGCLHPLASGSSSHLIDKTFFLDIPKELRCQELNGRILAGEQLRHRELHRSCCDVQQGGLNAEKRSSKW